MWNTRCQHGSRNYMTIHYLTHYQMSTFLNLYQLLTTSFDEHIGCKSSSDTHKWALVWWKTINTFTLILLTRCQTLERASRSSRRRHDTSNRRAFCGLQFTHKGKHKLEQLLVVLLIYLLYVHFINSLNPVNKHHKYYVLLL